MPPIKQLLDEGRTIRERVESLRVRTFASLALAVAIAACLSPAPWTSDQPKPPTLDLPAEVAGRRPLPPCGTEVVVVGMGASVPARRCFWEAHRERRPAELISFGTTIEGDWVVRFYRTDPTVEGVIVYVDETRDRWGSGEWLRLHCRVLRVPERELPAFELEVDDCSEDVLNQTDA